MWLQSFLTAVSDDVTQDAYVIFMIYESDGWLCFVIIVFSVIFCEAVAIYGVIVAIILQTKLESVPPAKIYSADSLRAGYAIFASGIIVGFANLVCGYVFLFLLMMLFRSSGTCES